jgi:hypothetical protein
MSHPDEVIVTIAYHGKKKWAMEAGHAELTLK